MTTNQTIDGVPRETVEITRELAEQLTEGWNGVNARIELRKMLDADKVNNRQMGLMQFVEAHPVKPAAQPQGEPVAYRIGVNGEWFYGDKLSCIRERVEYESTFTKEDFEEAGVVTPEPLYAEQPAPVAPTPINYGALDPVERLAVCRGEVAPVAVVLPERKHVPDFTQHPLLNKEYTGWNAYDTELKRLNPSL